ncbi:MAG: cytidine deaminase [Planctomycetes bacterium]|nr:cytidine deaminase [Planctomycetota bacterium]
MDLADLVAAARAARDHAYCPYSNFAVGAAVATSDGTVFTGVNVENASYGLTICAERVALSAAVAAGHRTFAALAIASPRGASCCGACRQFIREFATSLPIYLAAAEGDWSETDIADLLPESFGPDDLDA